MFQKVLMAFHKTEKTVSAERLHEALHRTQSQDVVKFAVNYPAICRLFFPVVANQFVSLRLGKVNIGIKKQRGQIVLGQTGTHALEIDQISQAVAGKA